MSDEGPDSPFRYHLELTPQQLKVTHTALRSLLDDFGHDEATVHALIHEVLAKLPDEHAIRAIRLDGGTRAADELLAAPPASSDAPSLDEVRPPEGDDEPPPSIA
jgi:hypothetical protein